MPFKNLVILFISVIVVVGGGFLISQYRSENPSETGFIETGDPTISPILTVSPTLTTTISPTTSPRPRVGPKPTVSLIPTPEPSESPSPSPSPSVTVTPTPSPVKSTLISYTNSGFVPTYVEIEAGAVITFENDSTSSMWPASDNHPTHTLYPGSGTHKCDTHADEIFDACGPVQPGESWSFEFKEKGTWKYHDHLSPGYGGIILVK